MTTLFSTIQEHFSLKKIALSQIFVEKETILHAAAKMGNWAVAREVVGEWEGKEVRDVGRWVNQKRFSVFFFLI